jgi:uncharacterized membrane protein YtjA (UPF0391 family)
MLRLALAFLVIAFVAALLGFGFVAGMSFEIGKLLFIVFVVLAVLSFLGGVVKRPPV